MHGTMARKSHTKSRRGCFNCKQRRVKCGEEKPECQKCLSRDDACRYPPSNSLIWTGGISSTPSVKAGKESSEPSPPAYTSRPQNEAGQLTNDPSLDLQNINLIIHWFTTTVHTVNSATNTSALQICQTTILTQATQHPFLLHGLLALSALHLADSHPDPQEFTKIATKHHTQGLALYHFILADINKENFVATIAFSSLTIMFAFGVSRPEAGKEVRMGIVDQLVQIFELVKGWHSVAKVADGLDCRVGTFPPAQHIKRPPLSAEIEAAFDGPNHLNHGPDMELYKLAISSLKTVFCSLAEDRGNPHVALEWANTLPIEFVRLIRERQSLALVLLGYYCVVLEERRKVWWLKGWSKGLFSVVWQAVGSAEREALEWARGKIGDGVVGI